MVSVLTGLRAPGNPLWSEAGLWTCYSEAECAPQGTTEHPRRRALEKLSQDLGLGHLIWARAQRTVCSGLDALRKQG